MTRIPLPNPLRLQGELGTSGTDGFALKHVIGKMQVDIPIIGRGDRELHLRRQHHYCQTLHIGKVQEGLLIIGRDSGQLGAEHHQSRAHRNAQLLLA